MDADDDNQPARPASDAPKELFERLAKTAERIAETAKASARVHDQMATFLPGAAEHAARERRLAAAEAEAANAYRNQQVPSDEVRQVIHEAGTGRQRPDSARPGAQGRSSEEEERP